MPFPVKSVRMKISCIFSVKYTIGKAYDLVKTVITLNTDTGYTDSFKLSKRSGNSFRVLELRQSYEACFKSMMETHMVWALNLVKNMEDLHSSKIFHEIGAGLPPYDFVEFVKDKADPAYNPVFFFYHKPYKRKKKEEEEEDYLYLSLLSLLVILNVSTYANVTLEHRYCTNIGQCNVNDSLLTKR